MIILRGVEMRIWSGLVRTGVAIAGLVCTAGTVGATQASAQASSTPVKLAYIRSQDIFAQAPGRAEAESQFNGFVETARAQEKAMGDSINVLLGDYAKSESTLAADVKQTRQQAIRDKQAQFQQRQQALEQQVQQKQGELVQPILERINKIINDLRNENGYAVVLDAQSTGGSVVAADKNLDITEQVIARLRTMSPGAPVSSTKPAPKPTTGPAAGPSGVGRPKSPSQ
jgi:outer membrane protein